LVSKHQSPVFALRASAVAEGYGGTSRWDTVVKATLGHVETLLTDFSNAWKNEWQKFQPLEKVGMRNAGAFALANLWRLP